MTNAFVAVETSCRDAQVYSGAVKDFVSALVTAIDRGDTGAVHQELREYNRDSIPTYEGGLLIRSLREPVQRLAAKNPVTGRMTIENASDKLRPDADPQSVFGHRPRSSKTESP